jgi:hypothetical protein
VACHFLACHYLGNFVSATPRGDAGDAGALWWTLSMICVASVSLLRKLREHAHTNPSWWSSQ